MLLYFVVWIVLLLSGTDVNCPMRLFPAGYTFSAPNCNGNGTCMLGGGACRCDIVDHRILGPAAHVELLGEQAFKPSRRSTDADLCTAPVSYSCARINSPCCGKHATLNTALIAA